MPKLSDNPAEVMHELLSDPVFKRHICKIYGIPEDTEINDESFKQAEELCMKFVDYAEEKIDAEKDFKPPSSDS